MDRTNTASALPLPRSWIAASMAFAFFVGVGLSIPLANEMRLAPTGYAEALSASTAGGGEAARRAETMIEKNLSGPCLNCTLSQDAISSDSSPGVVDPMVGFGGLAGVEV